MGEWLALWFGRVWRERYVIADAKGLFGMAAGALIVATAGLTWWLTTTLYGERLSTLEAHIQLLQGQLDQKRNSPQDQTPSAEKLRPGQEPTPTVPVPAPPVPAPSVEAPATRVFVDVTPAYLVSLYDRQHTSAQSDKLVEPYIGKWITVNGIVDDIRIFDGKRTIVSLALNGLDADRFEPSNFLMAVFDDDWAKKIEVLIRSQKIRIIGEIYVVDSKYVTLLHCEIPTQ